MTRQAILPLGNEADGTVNGGRFYSRDDRVPDGLRLPDSSLDRAEARYVGHLYRTEQCPDGRHLFDAIESSIEHEVELPDAVDGYSYHYEYDFRACLTCVRCGTVLAWEGRRTDDRRVTTLAPEPLAAGDLLAQMVHRYSGLSDWCRYDVYRTTSTGLVKVGHLSPESGPRGRAYMVGQLDEWGTGPGTYVEAKDALGALRAIVRRCRLEVAS